LIPISIDVVIPSYRVDEQYLLPILQLNVPDNAVVKFYLVIDNLNVTFPPDILSIVDNEVIFLIVNEQNIGAASTRNAGINAGKGDWILFLDDDIAIEPNLLSVYCDAILKHSTEIGFIGLVNFNEPANSFNKAIQASGSIDIFSIAARRPSFAWGATANMIVNRAAMGLIRFDKVFPKNGGAEDIDFFFAVRQQNQFKNYLSLPQAAVTHPWWSLGKPDFKRSFRYGRGSGVLYKKNPAYTYYDFLNTAEILFIILTVLLISAIIPKISVASILLFTVGLLIIEFVANAIQSLKRKSGLNLLIVFYLMLLRLSYQFGLLFQNLSSVRVTAIGLRFNDDGSFKKTRFYRANSYKIVKWILYPVLIYLFIRFKPD